MLSGQKKVLDLRCCKFVVVPNSKVCWGQGALGLGANFGNVFCLGDNMHGPICLGGIVRNARNMPIFLVDFKFLNSSASAKIQTSGTGWNLEHWWRCILDGGRLSAKNPHP